MNVYVFLFLFLLIEKYFGLIDLRGGLLVLIVVVLGYKQWRIKSLFSTYIWMVYFFMFLSAISSYVYRGQTISQSFSAEPTLLYLLFYFVLKRYHMTIIQIEKIIYISSLLFVISYIIQYMIYPIAIFSGAAVVNPEIDDVRFRLIGQGLASVGLFMGFNKYIINRNKRYLCLFLGAVFVIVLLGFRTMMACSIFFLIWMYVRIKGFNFKNLCYLFLGGIVFICLLNIPVFYEKIIFMIERNVTDNFSNDDYVRIVNFNYFINEHFNNTIEWLLGTGIPNEHSSYGFYMLSELALRQITYVDWGLLGLSWTAGIGTVVVMIMYSVRAITLKVDNSYFYINVWFMYMLMISITTMEFYREGNLAIQAILLYLVEMTYTEKKKNYENTTCQYNYTNV